VSVSELFVAVISKVHFYREDGDSMFLQNTGDTLTNSISTNIVTIIGTYYVFVATCLGSVATLKQQLTPSVLLKGTAPKHAATN
jgi:hypothetical protein